MAGVGELHLAQGHDGYRRATVAQSGSLVSNVKYQTSNRENNNI